MAEVDNSLNIMEKKEPEKSNQEKQEEIKQNMLKVIMRQTDYDLEKAEESLCKYGTVEKCIEEYLGVVSVLKTKQLTTNQAIYKSIREWMN